MTEEDMRKDTEAMRRELSYFYKNNHPKNVRQVYGIDKDGNAWSLIILKEIATNEGTFLEVELPS